MTDTVTCNKCGRGGFTPQGLARHTCKPTAVMQSTDADAQAEADGITPAMMTEGYQQATSGLWLVVKFGAMMIRKRATISGHGRDGEGLRNWLKENCPTVNSSTAYRFMAVAQGAALEAKLGKRVDLLHLLDTSPAELSVAELKKRNAIEAMIAGKSQRRLLLTFGASEQKKLGGKREGAGRPAAGTPTALEHEREAAVKFWNGVMQSTLLHAKEFRDYQRLTDDERTAVSHTLREIAEIIQPTTI